MEPLGNNLSKRTRIQDSSYAIRCPTTRTKIQSVSLTMAQPTPRSIKKVTLDDADLQNRNEALIIENEIIKEDILDIKQSEFDLARRVEVLIGVQTIGALRPEQVRAVR